MRGAGGCDCRGRCGVEQCPRATLFSPGFRGDWPVFGEHSSFWGRGAKGDGERVNVRRSRDVHKGKGIKVTPGARSRLTRSRASATTVSNASRRADELHVLLV